MPARSKTRAAARLALVLACAIAAFAPATATAASPVLIGDGVEAGVTVDPAGTAYIAWIGHEPSTTSLHFCRLPRGARACAVNVTINAPGTSLSRPYTVVSGSTVRVISYRYGLSGPSFAAVYMFTSTNGGASFDAGAPIGTIAFHDAILGPGGTVALIEDVGTSKFQQVPIDGSGAASAFAELAPDHPYSPSIALTGPNSLLAVFDNGSSAAQFRRWTGSGDPNSAGSWTPAQDFAAYSAYNRLASGPAGVFLLSDSSNGKFEVRRFAADGSGFSAPVPVPGPADDLTGDSKDMTEDPGGRLHVIWPFGDAAGAHVGYATSDNGTSWQQTSFDVGNPNDINQAALAMRVAVAADHLGVAVWHSANTTPQIFALAIGPSAGVKPVLGKTAAVSTVKGTVLVKRPGASGFVKLTAATTVPVGSTLDTSNGTVRLATATGAGKPDQSGQFNGGRFVVQQGRRNPLTTLKLVGGGLDKCKPARGARSHRRRLFSQARGHFRTRGRYAEGTVRGTSWLTQDTCAGTLIAVRSGTVYVRDFRKHRTVPVRKGQRYLARAR